MASATTRCPINEIGIKPTQKQLNFAIKNKTKMYSNVNKNK